MQKVKKRRWLVGVCGLACWLACPSKAATNTGLVGVATIAPDALDALGETLGGVFSGMWWDESTHTLYALADRGPLDGKFDFRPRVQKFTVGLQTVTGQINLSNTVTILLRAEDDRAFSGADAAAPTTDVPRTLAGLRAIDPEALTHASGGTFWIGDEYGPLLYQFDAEFRLRRTLRPPEHIVPRQGATITFSSAQQPSSGRAKNRGFEGVSVTPDGGCLFAMLQSPCVQDDRRHARLLEWDLKGAEPKLVGEYFYELTLLDGGERAATQSEIFALNLTTLLVLERDEYGLGEKGEKRFCRIYLAQLDGATNLLTTPPSEIRPLSKRVFLDLLDRTELAKAGLTLAQLPAKWEGLALVPRRDWGADEYLLLVGVDNDFKTRRAVFCTAANNVKTNLQVVGEANAEVLTLLLAYRVTLPEYAAPQLAVDNRRIK